MGEIVLTYIYIILFKISIFVPNCRSLEHLLGGFHNMVYVGKWVDVWILGLGSCLCSRKADRLWVVITGFLPEVNSIPFLTSLFATMVNGTLLL